MDLENRLAILAGRVLFLEQRVEALEEQEKRKQKSLTNNKVESDVALLRTPTRRAGLESLNMHLEHTGLSLLSGGKRLGRIQYLVSPDSRKRKICLAFSRSYAKSDDEIRGWHTIRKEMLDDKTISFFIFGIEGDASKYYFFIIPRNDMNKLIGFKTPDDRGYYHFGIYRDSRTGKYLDPRNPETKEIDMSKYYEAWKLLE